MASDTKINEIDVNLDSAAPEITEDIQSPLTNYLLVLIEVKKVIEKSHATDMPTLESYVAKEKLNGLVKSILEREIQVVANQDIVHRLGPIEGLKQHVGEGIEEVKYLNKVINGSPTIDNNKTNETTLTAVNKIVDSVIGEQNAGVSRDGYQSLKETGSIIDPTNVDLHEMSKIASVVREYLHGEERKLGHSKQEVVDTPVVDHKQASNQEQEVDMRNVEYGTHPDGLGDVIVVEKQAEPETIATDEELNKAALSELEQKKALKDTQEQQYKQNVALDMFQDTKHEKAVTGIKDDFMEAESKFVDGVLKSASDIMHEGVSNVAECTNTQESPNDTPKIEQEEKGLGRK